MFKTKDEFKKIYKDLLMRKHGRTIKESDAFERFSTLTEIVQDCALEDFFKQKARIKKEEKKELIYLSMEFLMGRLLLNNLQNLGIYQIVKQGLEELEINMNELEELESDAGLGNGGLGRLAACFLDSIASLGYPGHGNCIRYQYGFFRQRIIKGEQRELPDQWLYNGFSWEKRNPSHECEIKFYGSVESSINEKGLLEFNIVHPLYIRAVPYDVSIIGYRNKVVNTLRLWNAEPSVHHFPDSIDFTEYLRKIELLTHGLYPDDSTEEGRILRLMQQYFLSSAAIQSVVKSFYKIHQTVKGLSKRYIFQLNDTHPIFAIPELMRVLIDDYKLSWDEAWEEVSNCFAFTNHTVLPEGLEKWPVHYVQTVLPRIYLIVEELNKRFNLELLKKNVNPSELNKMSIIGDGQIRMANLAIYACNSINGVAEIHTSILKADTFKEFNDLYPEKFNNKTNGVTHRRWVANANPLLSSLISKKIGTGWITDFSQIKKFEKFKTDGKVLKELRNIKFKNKLKVVEYIKKVQGLDIDPNTIFDVQIKRLHAYKRQLMNIFHVMYLYQRLKEDKNFKYTPTTFFFGAKAAPSYVFAKNVIELIVAVANVINSDPDVNKIIKVVFIENYGVSLAELLIPAADVSEQISTAGKEASGTSNMKFMMNGAITLGTMDGANIEIVKYAGKENAVIFGMDSKEVDDLNKNNSYYPMDIYNADFRVKKVIDSLSNGLWCMNNSTKFNVIFSELMNHRDEFYVLKDFDSYVKAHERINTLYADQEKWAKMCLINIANSGPFSSDRTIAQYVKDIWHLQKLID